MKVYLAKDITNLPIYGSVPDLTQGDTTVVDSFDISNEEGRDIDAQFVDQTNAVCDAALDLGDYQYYDAAQCKLLLGWLEGELMDEDKSALYNFYTKLKDYLLYAIDNNTGIAIEL